VLSSGAMCSLGCLQDDKLAATKLSSDSAAGAGSSPEQAVAPADQAAELKPAKPASLSRRKLPFDKAGAAPSSSKEADSAASASASAPRVLSERQQLALLLRMTDPEGSSPVRGAGKRPSKNEDDSRAKSSGRRAREDGDASDSGHDSESEGACSLVLASVDSLIFQQRRTATREPARRTA
jgi:hypothetical protein